MFCLAFFPILAIKIHKGAQLMLIEFSVSNYRSIKDKQTLSLVASKSTELQEENTFPGDKKTRLLKTAIVYGANASGKSNVFKALAFFFRFAVTSAFKQQIGESIRTESFLFDTTSKDQPSEFELLFFLDGARYRYGFEVDKTKVLKEWLFAVLNVQEVKLFTRNSSEETPRFSLSARSTTARSRRASSSTSRISA